MPEQRASHSIDTRSVPFRSFDMLPAASRVNRTGMLQALLRDMQTTTRTDRSAVYISQEQHNAAWYWGHLDALVGAVEVSSEQVERELVAAQAVVLRGLLETAQETLGYEKKST